MVFAVQADVMALFAAPKLGDALAAAAYHPTDTVVRKLWAQCETVLDRTDEVDTWRSCLTQPTLSTTLVRPSQRAFLCSWLPWL